MNEPQLRLVFWIQKIRMVIDLLGMPVARGDWSTEFRGSHLAHYNGISVGVNKRNLSSVATAAILWPT